MAAPQGHWRIVANAFQGDLNITTASNGDVTGHMQLDNSNLDPVHGFWDEAEQRLIIQRQVLAAGGKPQNYTGYLFPAGAPLFQDGTFGPPTTVKFRMLAGSFDAYDSGGNGARPLFGWVARQSV